MAIVKNSERTNAGKDEEPDGFLYSVDGNVKTAWSFPRKLTNLWKAQQPLPAYSLGICGLTGVWARL